MKRINYIKPLLFLINTILFAQFNFSKTVVDNNVNGICSVTTNDINNDGYIDIIGASWDSNTILWWENPGTGLASWTNQTIDNDIQGASFVASEDLDNDNDIDLVASGWDDNTISIFYNQNTTPITWNKIIIDDSFNNAHEVRIADIDSDGYYDIVGVASSSHTIAWWQNPGISNSGNWVKHIINTQCFQVRTVFPGDLNNDGRIDLVSASFYSNSIVGFLNNSDQTWNEIIIDNNFQRPHMINLSDLNNDGFLDVIAAGYAQFSNQDIAYWINDGSDQSNWDKIIVDGQFNGALGITAADLNYDDNIDLIGSSGVLNDVAIWKNDLSGQNSWEQTTIDHNLSGAWALECTDVDRDNDIDIIAGGSNDTQLVIYENLSNSNLSTRYLNNPEYITLNCYPNPFNPVINISYDIPTESYVSIGIYNINGKLIRMLLTNKYHWSGYHSIVWNGLNNNGDRVNSGIYFINLNSENTSFYNKVSLIR